MYRYKTRLYSAETAEQVLERLSTHIAGRIGISNHFNDADKLWFGNLTRSTFHIRPVASGRGGGAKIIPFELYGELKSLPYSGCYVYVSIKHSTIAILYFWLFTLTLGISQEIVSFPVFIILFWVLGQMILYFSFKHAIYVLKRTLFLL